MAIERASTSTVQGGDLTAVCAPGSFDDLTTCQLFDCLNQNCQNCSYFLPYVPHNKCALPLNNPFQTNPVLNNSCVKPGGTPYDITVYTFIFPNSYCDAQAGSIQPITMIHSPSNPCDFGAILGVQTAPPVPVEWLMYSVCNSSGTGLCNFATSPPTTLSSWCTATVPPAFCSSITAATASALPYLVSNPVPPGVCSSVYGGSQMSYVQYCGLSSVPAAYAPLITSYGKENCPPTPLPSAMPPANPLPLSVSPTWYSDYYIKPSPNNANTPYSFGAALSLSGDCNTLFVGAPLDPTAGTGVYTSAQRRATSQANRGSD